MTYLEKSGTFAYVILQHYQEIMAQPDVKSMKRLAEKFIRSEAKLQGTRAEEFLIYMWQQRTPEQLNEFFINKFKGAANFTCPTTD